ncbi:iron ABC transporter substrate-binding protein [Desulfonatronum sp. SC1]|uniref:iron ABC transporter substrate-binding protein n=1 Tax=Desulfonatronum sp. SC1 TaxID=2109626 RepID=UPI000D31C7CF|nr:iron ABC transporter substrate-binding protein [Desulfonatronum sp. SC1]PTN33468.1 iron ABC transporter substrate-binding protein [Desulfonatronum sp. SC1]
MRTKIAWFGSPAALIVAVVLFSTLAQAQDTRTITDALGRESVIPAQVDRVICSGSGCLRLLTYLQAHDRIVAVDSIEVHGSPIDARPYAIANPQFKIYPIFGEFRGQDSPELIAGLDPQPQVIFKTYAARDGDPEQLQTKTGIPVIALEYGNLTFGRKNLNESLLLIGEVMGTQERAAAVIDFFDALEADLLARTADVPDDQRPSTYIGGLGQRGPHGFQSTEPSFAPFAFTRANNVAASLSTPEQRASHATVSKEQIVIWDPEIIFIDVATMRLDAGVNALDQLRTDPAYQALSAVHAGRIYGLFPYNSYTQNFESVFANAYYVGKVLYPDRFADVDPMAKAEEIAILLNGGPAFEEMNSQFQGLAFGRIDIR